MTFRLVGEYPCQHGCGHVARMPGARANHEKVCGRTIEGMIRDAGVTADVDSCWVWPVSHKRARCTWRNPWTGTVQQDFVARVAYYLAYGWFDPQLYVCHGCDVPSCFNPNHLFLGTDRDNVRDMWTKGRSNLQNLSGAQRTEYARLAARARWDKRVQQRQEG